MATLGTMQRRGMIGQASTYRPTMTERIPQYMQDGLQAVGVPVRKANTIAHKAADVFGYLPVLGGVAPAWDAGVAAAKQPTAGGKLGALGGGMALAALYGLGGKGAARLGQAARQAPRAQEALVTNRLYSDRIMGPEYAQGAADLPQWAHRNIFSAQELDDILRSGYMRPSPRAKGGNNKYFTASNEPLPSAGNRGGVALRVDTRNIPVGQPVDARFVERWDDSMQRFAPVMSGAR